MLRKMPESPDVRTYLWRSERNRMPVQNAEGLGPLLDVVDCGVDEHAVVVPGACKQKDLTHEIGYIIRAGAAAPLFTLASTIDATTSSFLLQMTIACGDMRAT